MTCYIKTLIEISESFRIYIQPSFGFRSLQYKYRIPGKHCFCPQGCDCRHRDKGRRYLQCEKTNLTTFIITKKTNTDIDSIHLGGNYLKSFNGTQVSRFCPNLSMLDLKKNQLEKVENDTFRGFLQLELLDISYNNITEIDSDGFSDLRKLKTLHMRDNKINIVQNSWFKKLEEVRLIDLRHNLIQTFEPPYFRWPSNLKTLLLQGNSFHVIPPLSRLPDLVDLSDNEIDCSCQRLGQEKVGKDVLSKVTVTCNNKMSAGMWEKQHWENPFCMFPTVDVNFKECDEVYIVKCSGDGFPPPRVFLKHEGKVIATSVQNPQVIYALFYDINVTCEASSPVGVTKMTISVTDSENGLDVIENPHKKTEVHKCNNSSLFDPSVASTRLSMFSIFYYTITFISWALTTIALVVSLYIFLSAS